MFALAGPPVEVGVTMYVLSISSVSEVLMVFISVYIRVVHTMMIIRTTTAGDVNV